MCDLLAPLMVILDNGRKGFIVLHLFVSLGRSVFRNAGSEAAIGVNQGQLPSRIRPAAMANTSVLGTLCSLTDFQMKFH